mmetsp:Transcript_51840/g.146876  ORF Transcript_51840/g.146876 Transcript_51840/m.146876 type:complete len:617 (+) Transcript_51840:998-2848(+)
MQAWLASQPRRAASPRGLQPDPAQALRPSRRRPQGPCRRGLPRRAAARRAAGKTSSGASTLPAPTHLQAPSQPAPQRPLPPTPPRPLRPPLPPPPPPPLLQPKLQLAPALPVARVAAASAASASVVVEAATSPTSERGWAAGVSDLGTAVLADDGVAVVVCSTSSSVASPSKWREEVSLGAAEHFSIFDGNTYELVPEDLVLVQPPTQPLLSSAEGAEDELEEEAAETEYEVEHAAAAEASLASVVVDAVVAEDGQQEDLWEFVVQGRVGPSPEGDQEAMPKGITCFPASAMDRVREHGAAFVSVRGRRLDASSPNQDDLLLAMCRCSHEGRVALYGVFDGHGPIGHQSAAFARGFLPERIFGDPGLLADPEAVLRSAFQEAHYGLLSRQDRMPAHDSRASGTTATVALVLDLPHAMAPGGFDGQSSWDGADNGSAVEGLGTYVFVAHVGDSRAVLGSRAAEGGEQVVASALTREHRPDDAEEAARVVEAGGEVRKLKAGRSASRIYLPGRSQPGLALSRVLGDTAAGNFGVSAEPEITSFLARPQQDLMLLLGTDGFWEFCPQQEAIAQLVQDGASTEALEALCAESRRRWSNNSYNQTCDDATAIAVSLTAWNR